MKRNVNNIFYVVLVVGISLLLHRKYVNEFPSHIHAWAQSDRYALAIGFTENGMNFFHPSTPYLNPTPAESNEIREDGITSVDFPMHEYLVAIGMKLAGSNSPWIFRMYILLYSIVGMYFLYLLIKSLTGKPALSIISALLLSVSPVYVYYSSGFLPSVPSVANTIIAYYFYIRYFKEGRPKHFALSILFITLAVLARKPFVIFLLSILLQEIYSGIKNKRIQGSKIMFFLLSFGAIAGYHFYNVYLTNRYGSIFLGSLLPPENWEEIVTTLSYVWNHWILQYFSLYQYLFIFALIAIYAGQKLFIKQETSTLQKKLLFQVVVTLVGSLAYIFVMLKQFSAHDYYFLDSLYIPVILLCIFCLHSIRWSNISLYQGIISFSLIFLYTGIMEVKKTQETRRETGSWDEIQASINDFSTSSSLLRELNVPEDAKILVLNSSTTNIPHLLMKTKGFSVISTTKENLQKSLEWPFDYVVIQDRNVLNGVLKNYPEIVNRITRIGGNGKISIYRKEESNSTISILGFLQLDQQQPAFESTYLYNTENDLWTNVPFVKADTGLYGIISPEDLYGPAITLNNKDILQESSTLLISVDFFPEDFSKDLQIVVTSHCDAKNTFFESQPVLIGASDIKKWNKHYFLFSVPPQECSENKCKVYIWNPSSEAILYNNFSVSFY